MKAERIRETCKIICQEHKPSNFAELPVKCGQLLTQATEGERGYSLIYDNAYELEIVPLVSGVSSWKIPSSTCKINALLSSNSLLFIAEDSRLTVYDLHTRERLSQAVAMHRITALAHDK